MINAIKLRYFAVYQTKTRLLQERFTKIMLSHDTPIFCIGYPKFSMKWYKFLNKFCKENHKYDLTVFFILQSISRL